MAERAFLQIRHRDVNGDCIHLVHKAPPRFGLEIEPAYNDAGRMVSGTIRRVCFPNSATGQYHQYGRLVAEAERFFRRTLLEEGDAPSFSRG